MEDRQPGSAASKPVAPGTYLLLTVIVAVFIAELVRHATGSEAALLRMGAIPNDGRLRGEPWRLITYAFLHFDWGHLVMNTMLLWWTGRIVERRLGTVPAMGIYFLAVLVAGSAVLVLRGMYPKEGSTMGASGGVFAMLAAALVLAYRPAAVAAFGRNAGMRAGLWIAMGIAVVMSLRPGVSMAGHIGGLACGLPLGALLRVRRRPDPDLERGP